MTPAKLRFRAPVRQLVVLGDGIILSAAFLLAFHLRFELALPPGELARALQQLPLVLLVQLATLGSCHVYGFLWRYVGLHEALAFARAAAASVLLLLALRLGLALLAEPPVTLMVPISVTLMSTVIGFSAVLAARVVLRTWHERRERESKRVPGGSSRRPLRTLLVGAGQAGLMATRELSRQPHPSVELCGFVDDDPKKQGAVVNGIPVLGTLRDLEPLARAHRIEQLLVTMVQVDRSVLRGLIAHAEQLGLPLRTIPGLHEILEGRVSYSRLREVSIEDLLARPPVQLEKESLARFLSGRRVLVTGAGGSIGSELVRQVVAFGPERVLLVERAEPALFDVHRGLLAERCDCKVVPLLADVGDEHRMQAILREHRPQVILHAAAHKHVPLVEHHNTTEALRNNVLATHLLGSLAGEHGVESFVLISSDKAVRPTSVMGATKRLAELVVQDLDARYATRYVAVRFGNVLGSSGSVVPIFTQQIANGGPVTVTHPEMVRYFMTIPEAAQLVLQASARGRGGEIFVLDMGDPVRIVDLARAMIRLSGLEPDVDVEIVFSGIRPGEKLCEELQHREEGLAPTTHPRIFVGHLQPYPAAVVTQALHRLRTLVGEGPPPEVVRAFLAELLPEARLGLPPSRPVRVFVGDAETTPQAELPALPAPGLA